MVYNVLINRSECVHYDDVVVNEIICGVSLRLGDAEVL